MRISDFIARTVTQRRSLVWCGVGVLILVCIAILFTSLRLDSEIFNVLPGKFASVQGLKTYDHDFEQTRELTFAKQSPGRERCTACDIRVLHSRPRAKRRGSQNG